MEAEGKTCPSESPSWPGPGPGACLEGPQSPQDQHLLLEVRSAPCSHGPSPGSPCGCPASKLSPLLPPAPSACTSGPFSPHRGFGNIVIYGKKYIIGLHPYSWPRIPRVLTLAGPE